MVSIVSRDVSIVVLEVAFRAYGWTGPMTASVGVKYTP
jgi:hypothetical protein